MKRKVESETVSESQKKWTTMKTTRLKNRDEGHDERLEEMKRP